MSEQDNLQEADGIEKQDQVKAEDASANPGADTSASEVDKSEIDQESTQEEIQEAKVDESASEEQDEALKEIESSNAVKAESEETSSDTEGKEEEKDYKSMSMEDLVSELENLLKTDSIHLVRSQAESIKSAFNKQFSALLENKKKQFLEEGGNSIDFRFDFPLKSKFNNLFREYRERRQSYYKNLEKTLHSNLENRLEIIEEIKNLLNVEEDINSTYKNFKALQERWRNAGPIPRDRYNNVWNNYHHHVENFYDFLHLNRDLRDLDFKHNLEQKLLIIERAEELAKDEDSNRAFRELQALHKMWKEELGPVAKEHREEIWERFRAATKAIHEKRQAYFEKLDEAYQKNLEHKQQIISKIWKLTKDIPSNHSAWQKRIKEVESLRQEFFNAGKVPIKVNEATWAEFKEAVRSFNREKNVFYKSMKKEQYENLKKKLALIETAEEHKDSEDFKTVTPIMKRIQSEWKKIGHVPRKDSDAIWERFKSACNHYFDRLHEQKDEANKEELENYEKKNELLSGLKELKFSNKIEEDIALIKNQVENWKTIGPVPRNKRYIEGKFNKAINTLYGKLKADPKEVELLKFDAKIESFSTSDNQSLLDNEHNYIRKQIDEIKSEINQLENNLLFFSNVNEDNPLVKEVHKNIEKQRSQLDIWEEKLKRIRQYY